jgi:hypothetical protein
MTRVIALAIGLLLMGPAPVLVAADTSIPPCDEGRPHERGGGRRCNSNGGIETWEWTTTYTYSIA